MKKMFIIAAIALVAASCNTSYDKTKSGLTYKIIKGKGGPKLKSGDVVKINGLIKIAPRDTVLFVTDNMPEYIPVDTSSRLTHDFNEVLKLCSVGDSLITIAQVDTLVKRGQGNYNGFFKRGDQIVTGLRIIKAFPNNEEMMKDRQQEMDKQKTNEVAAMEAMLKKKGIKAEKTENGVFVEILNAGSAEKMQNGKQATVNYTGTLIETGKAFDSNTDTTFHHLQPFQFVAGSGQVIRGWDEGIVKLGLGGKANFYIPSMMAYGPQGSPPVIPRFAGLKFEIELLKVDDAPPPQPKMPMNMPQHGDPRNHQQQGGNGGQ